MAEGEAGETVGMEENGVGEELVEEQAEKTWWDTYTV